MTTKQPPFCPHLSQGQIVSMGFVGVAAPDREIPVQGDPVGHPSLRGGVDLSQMGIKKAMSYQFELNAKLKTPEGTDPKDPNPDLLPTASLIPCQGPACAFWCSAHEACREVCNACKVQTFVDALATHHRATSLPLDTHQPGQTVPGEPAV